MRAISKEEQEALRAEILSQVEKAFAPEFLESEVISKRLMDKSKGDRNSLFAKAHHVLANSFGASYFAFQTFSFSAGINNIDGADFRLEALGAGTGEADNIKSLFSRTRDKAIAFQEENRDQIAQCKYSVKALN